MTGWEWAFWASGGVIALAGLLLCAWALFRDRARGRRRCPRCWYDMSAVPGMKCPECGRTARKERRFFRTRRRWRWGAAGLTVAGVGAGTAAVPLIATGDWILYAPPSLLSASLSFFDEEAERQYQLLVVPTRGSFMGVASVSSPSQWQRLLVARRCASLLDDTTTTVPLSWGPNGTVRGEWLIRDEAIHALGGLEREARVAVPALLRCSRSDEPFAGKVLWGLRWLHPSAGMPILRRVILENPDATLREAAVRMGVDIEFESGGMAAVLERAAVADRDASVRVVAVRLVPRAGAGRAWAMRVLRRAVRDEAESVRITAVEALSVLSEGVDRLEVSKATNAGAALAYPSIPVRVRWTPSPAMREEIAELLRSRLSDGSVRVRRVAAAAMGRMGAAGLPHCEEMARAFEREADEQARVVLAIAIEYVQGMEAALPLLERMLNSPDARVARVARQHVETAITSESEPMRRRAAAALETLDAKK